MTREAARLLPLVVVGALALAAGCNEEPTKKKPNEAARPVASPSARAASDGSQRRPAAPAAPAAPSPQAGSLQGSPLDYPAAPVSPAVTGSPAVAGSPGATRTLTASRATSIVGVDAQAGTFCAIPSGATLALSAAPEAHPTTPATHAVVSFPARQGCPLTRAAVLRQDWTGF